MYENITVNGETFRKCVKSALTVTVKKAAFPMPEQILVKASSGKVYVCANNCTQSVRYTMNCDHNGEFEVTLYNVTIKKLLNVKGDRLTISHPSEKILKVESGKKSMELNCEEPENGKDCGYGSFTAEMSKERTPLFTVDYAELSSGINVVSAFRSDINNKPILCGYGFNNGIISAIDGYHTCRKTWKNYSQLNEYKFTASGELENIKNIFPKSTKQVNVSGTKFCDTWTIFSASDGEITVDYCVRNIQGDFCDTNAYYPKTCQAEISVNAGEILEIAKEYKGYIDSKNKMPVELRSTDKELSLYLRTNDIKVSQGINSDYDGRINIHVGYKAEFMIDCFSLYGKNEIVKLRYDGNSKPLYITNGEYECLLLPVRLRNEDVA